MKNRKEYGIKFRMSDSSGIAAVVVFDKTDDVYVLENGSTQTNYAEQLVDLYLATSGYTDDEKDFVYWISLESGHLYDIYAKRTGTHNALSSGYDLNIVALYDVEKVIDSEITSLLTTYHEDNPDITYTYDFDIYTYPLYDAAITQQSQSLAQNQYFYTTSTGQALFSLAGETRASKFMKVSINNGLSWLYPYDISFTWGSNVPYYNDETISIDGYFSVLFNEDIPSGETIIINFIPLVNRCYLEHSIQQPISLDSSYTDLRAHTRFMDYAIEIFPKE